MKNPGMKATASHYHEVVIVGGGARGLAAAPSLLRRRPRTSAGPKKNLMPTIHFDAMLKGHEWLAKPTLREAEGS